MLLINFIYSLVGAFGRGPKYLSDEYAVMDTRYWPLDDPAVAWISYIEVAIMIPLCFAWYVYGSIFSIMADKNSDCFSPDLIALFNVQVLWNSSK